VLAFLRTKDLNGAKLEAAIVNFVTEGFDRGIHRGHHGRIRHGSLSALRMLLLRKQLALGIRLDLGTQLRGLTSCLFLLKFCLLRFTILLGLSSVVSQTIRTASHGIDLLLQHGPLEHFARKRSRGLGSGCNMFSHPFLRKGDNLGPKNKRLTGIHSEEPTKHTWKIISEPLFL
jgi:hypothetical protein